MNAHTLRAIDRGVLQELAPVARRAADLDPRSIARIRTSAHGASLYVRLPFDVLVGRTVRTDEATIAGDSAISGAVDLTVGATELLAWVDTEMAPEPQPRDTEWRSGLPPPSGWQRIETIPDHVIRPLVRAGALALKEAAAREGVPGAQPRAEVADALLNSIVLTAHHERARADISLRALSALTRMGFLKREGSAHIDIAGRWVRIAAEYGTVFVERPGAGLTLR